MLRGMPMLRIGPPHAAWRRERNPEQKNSGAWPEEGDRIDSVLTPQQRDAGATQCNSGRRFSPVRNASSRWGGAVSAKLVTPASA